MRAVRFGLAALALGALSTPARADVVAQDAGGFVVRIATEVPSSPAEAWRTLVMPAQWWSSQHTFSGEAANLTLDPVAGGCFCEKLPVSKDVPAGTRPGGVQHMRVVYVEPLRAMRLSGALGPLQSEALTGTMTITLKPIESGTRILFEYVVGGYMRYKPEEIAPAVDRMLTAQLASLAGKLGGSGAAAPVVAPAPQGDGGAAPDRPAAGPPAAGPSASGADAPPPRAPASRTWSLPPGPARAPAPRPAAPKTAAAKPPAPKPTPAKSTVVPRPVSPSRAAAASGDPARDSVNDAFDKALGGGD